MNKTFLTCVCLLAKEICITGALRRFLSCAKEKISPRISTYCQSHLHLVMITLRQWSHCLWSLNNKLLCLYEFMDILFLLNLIHGIDIGFSQLKNNSVSIIISFVCWSTHQRCFIIKSVLRNFAKFTGKQACNFIEKETLLKQFCLYRN